MRRAIRRVLAVLLFMLAGLVMLLAAILVASWDGRRERGAPAGVAGVTRILAAAPLGSDAIDPR